MILSDERVVLLDGRSLLFLDPRTDELWTAGGRGSGPGEFAGSVFHDGSLVFVDGLPHMEDSGDGRLQESVVEFSEEGERRAIVGFLVSNLGSRVRSESASRMGNQACGRRDHGPKPRPSKSRDSATR